MYHQVAARDADNHVLLFKHSVVDVYITADGEEESTYEPQEVGVSTHEVHGRCICKSRNMGYAQI